MIVNRRCVKSVRLVFQARKSQRLDTDERTVSLAKGGEGIKYEPDIPSFAIQTPPMTTTQYFTNIFKTTVP